MNLKFYLLEIYCYLILILNLIVPFNILPKSEILLIIGFILFLIDFTNNKSGKKYLSILIMGLILAVITGILSTKLLILSQASYFFILIYFLNRRNFKINFLKTNKVAIKIIVYVSVISMTLQFSASIPEKGRYYLAVDDPNFSGFLILILFYLSVKSKSYVAIIFCILSLILIQSRNYLLAIFLFIFINFTKNSLYNIYDRIFKPFNLLITGNFFLILFSIFWVLNFNPTTQRSDLRQLNFNDNSNYYRFMWNLNAISIVTEHTSVLLSGGKEFGNDPLPIKPPHSSFFQYLLVMGLPITLLTIIGIMYLIKSTYYRLSYQYLVPAIFYSYFLHSIYYLSYFSLIIVILLINDKNNDHYSNVERIQYN